MAHRQSNSDASSGTGTAQLLVVLLAFAWGFMWMATATGLRDIAPWILRMTGTGLGAATLFIAARIAGFDLTVPPRQRFHVMAGGFFNVGAFHILMAFSQLYGATSRTVIIAYTMPIWVAALSVVLLHERLDRIRIVALGLCVAGIGILVGPLFADGFPTFVIYAFTGVLSWAFGTVYMKWQHVTVPPLANAAWQLLFGFCFLLAGTLIFEGMPRLWPISTASIVALVYIGLFGVGLAHFLWWSIVGQLSPLTASIGALLVPVVGVTTSIVFLGERPTLADSIGFVLIFSAAASVLLQPAFKAATKRDKFR